MYGRYWQRLRLTWFMSLVSLIFLDHTRTSSKYWIISIDVLVQHCSNSIANALDLNRIMYGSAWIILSRVRRFGKEIIAELLHEWQNIVVNANPDIILFLTLCLSSENTNLANFATVTKDGLFWLSSVTSKQLICDITRTRGPGIITSYSSIVLARANWRKDDLHVWITTVNRDFPPPGIHG